MEWIWQAQIGINLFFQHLGGWLALPIQFLSFFGTQEAFFFIIVVFYWCIDSYFGFRLAVMLILTGGLNNILKMAFFSPRPYWFDSRVAAISGEPTFGLPSAHAQNSTAVWGLLATRLKRTPSAFIWLGIVLIGISRLYLGVHFAIDVLVGWMLGGLLLWAFLRWEMPVSTWLKKLRFNQLVLFAITTSLVWIAVPLVVIQVESAWHIPDFWITNSKAAAPQTPIDPLDPSTTFTIAGTWLGMIIGAAWMHHFEGGMILSKGSPNQNILRYAIGAAGILVFWIGLGQVFPHSNDVIGLLLRFLRYSLVGLWAFALAPILFKKFHLA